MAKAPAVVAPPIDIGIPEAQRLQIAEGLGRVLADSTVLYAKTHGFHWNVTGPMFNTLHLMFMEQYTELWTALDEIAEHGHAVGDRVRRAHAPLAAVGAAHLEDHAVGVDLLDLAAVPEQRGARAHERLGDVLEGHRAEGGERAAAVAGRERQGLRVVRRGVAGECERAEAQHAARVGVEAEAGRGVAVLGQRTRRARADRRPRRAAIRA